MSEGSSWKPTRHHRGQSEGGGMISARRASTGTRSPSSAGSPSSLANPSSPGSLRSYSWRRTSARAEIHVGSKPLIVPTSKGTDLAQYPLPVNIYGMAIFTLAWEDFAGFDSRRCIRQSVAFTLFVCSVVLQLGLCWMILAGPINFEQEQYKKAHDKDFGAMLKAAIAANHPLDPNSEVVVFCTKEHCSVRGVIMVYYFVVFLWISRMMQELSELLWLLIAIWNVPSLEAYTEESLGTMAQQAAALCAPCSRPADASSSDDEDGDKEDLELQPKKDNRRPRFSSIDVNNASNEQVASKLAQLEDGLARNEDVHIVRIHPAARAMMFASVGGLRLITYLLVQWVGIKFLLMSQSTISMIIKCLAFQYIVTIPDLLFNATASDAMRRRVTNSHLYFSRPTLKQWDEWGSSVVRLSAIFCITAAVFNTSNSGFHTIMLMRYDCQEYARIWGTPQGNGRDWEMLLQDLRSPWDSKSYF